MTIHELFYGTAYDRCLDSSSEAEEETRSGHCGGGAENALTLQSKLRRKNAETHYYIYETYVYIKGFEIREEFSKFSRNE